jgi:hypothetical protein
MINNQKYITPEIIAFELSQIYKSKTWDIGSVRTWCMNVETRFIKDIETMIKYEEIDLTVNNNMVLLPCNIFRILDVYLGDNQIGLDYKNNGSYLYDLKQNGNILNLPDNSIIYINYRGINIDTNTGEFLIVKGHEEACKTYCKIQMFEEDVALGKFNASLWAGWQQQFSGQFLGARNNYQHKSRKQIDDLNIIRGNMIQKIGDLSLYHELFK